MKVLKSYTKLRQVVRRCRGADATAEGMAKNIQRNMVQARIPLFEQVAKLAPPRTRWANVKKKYQRMSELLKTGVEVDKRIFKQLPSVQSRALPLRLNRKSGILFMCSSIALRLTTQDTDIAA